MTEVYSHSRLSTFEQCPRKFKFRYIEKIIPEVEKTIEAHLGKAVHSSLQWLYTRVKEGFVPSTEELIECYADAWEEEFSPNIISVNKVMTHNDYFNRGVEFLTTYYLKHKPFNDNTIEVEKRIVIELDASGKYKIQGFIDRLAYNIERQELEIHDYKTSNSMPSKEKIESDRQLALYSIAIKEMFGKEKSVKLTWHYLAHNQKITITKSNEELEKLKKDTISLIKKIESTNHFPTFKTPLCSWCEYKSICPAWGNTPPKFTAQKTLKEVEDENAKPLDIWD